MDPFHEGERRAQACAGQEELARRHGRMISTTIQTGALSFLAGLPLVALATREDGRPRASIVAGEPGLLVPTPRTVELVMDRIAPDPEGPLARVEGDVGLLAIELATRRRYRVNGPIERTRAGLTIAVREAFPNCPQYIQRRRLLAASPRQAVRPSLAGNVLGPEQVALLRRADTAFVASAHPERGLDASHRGGPPGFIEVVAEDRLRVPDYSGNGLFQTLGNLLVDPRVGLAILDFDTSRLLEVRGRATISFGAERSWEVAIDRFTERDLPLTLRWSEVEPYDSGH